MLKRTTATLATAGALALLVTPPARAAGPDQLDGYAAGSSATALEITLVDQELAFSATSAAVSSEGPAEGTAGPTAAADGAALLLAGTPVPSGAPSQTPGGQPSNDACPVGVDLGDLTGGAASGLTVAIACVATEAAVAEGAPVASSESGEVTLQLNGLSGEVLDPIVGPLVAALEDALGQVDQAVLCTEGGLLDQLGVCEVVEQTTQIDVDALVDEVIANVGELGNGLFTVAQVRVAPALSQASADGERGVVASAGSSGVFIELFPGLAAQIDEIVDQVIPDAEADAPLLTLGLGNAQAEVVRHPATGEAVVKASAAQLLGVDVTDSLGILSELLEVQVPGLVDTLAEAGAALSCDGGALADLVCVDLGTVNDLDADELAARGYSFGEGTVGREATAAAVAVLPILGEQLGGTSVLGLELAQASAAANAVPAAPPAPTEDVPLGELPKTGADVSTPLALGLFAAAAAGIAMVRRARHT
jgi:LPXTG-motif cell wall-anchored protein